MLAISPDPMFLSSWIPSYFLVSLYVLTFSVLSPLLLVCLILLPLKPLSIYFVYFHPNLAKRFLCGVEASTMEGWGVHGGPQDEFSRADQNIFYPDLFFGRRVFAREGLGI